MVLGYRIKQMKREFVVTAASITMLSTFVVGSIFATENRIQIVA